MNAVIYARFSPRPNGEECLSIEKQFDRCRAYCVAMGYDVLGARSFSDEALSGATTDGRHALEDALTEACRLKAVLVVYDLTRLARNTRDALDILERLQKAGANLAMVNNNIDTSTPMGRCFFTMMAAIGTLEREETSRRTSDAMLHHQANGRRMSFIAPYGWKIDPKNPSRLIKDAHEQYVIVNILKLHESGDSLRAIAKHLNNEGYFCRNSPFRHKTIKRILQREGATFGERIG